MKTAKTGYRPWPKQLAAAFWIWQLVMAVPAFAAAVLIKPYWQANDVKHFLVAILVVSLVAAALFGVYLGVYRLGKYLPKTVLGATAILMLVYVLLMAFANNNPTSDDAAGVGLVIFTLPLAIVLGVMVWTGYLLGLGLSPTGRAGRH